MSNPASTVARRGPPKLSDALDPIARDAHPHDMVDPFDIGEALAMLAENGDPVTVYPSEFKQIVLMGRIASVDPEHPHFVFELAEGETLPAGAATFVASLGGNAKLQFQLSQDWSTLPDQPHLLPAAFPPSCQVLNRRAGQRLETPLGPTYMATFGSKGRSYELQLYDFSMGGVGMRATPEAAAGLYVGTRLEAVRLDLGGELSFTADLEIRLLRNFRSFLLGEQVQIGCAFSKMTPAIQESMMRLLSTPNSPRRRT